MLELFTDRIASYTERHSPDKLKYKKQKEISNF